MSRRVAAPLERAALISGDDLAGMVVRGGVGPVGHPAAEATRQLRLRTVNVATLATTFAAAGFTPVVDHLVPDRDALALLTDIVRPRPLLLASLGPRDFALASRPTRSRAGTCPPARSMAPDRTGRSSAPRRAASLDVRAGLGSVGPGGRELPPGRRRRGCPD